MQSSQVTHAGRPRGWALVLPVIVTILVGAGLGGFVVLENQREAERVEAADDVASDYLNDVATFRVRIAKALKEADQKDPASLAAALKKAVADPPALPEVDSRAAQQSSTYAEAERVADELLVPYDGLADAFGKAERDQRFVQAAEKVLAMRASDYVDGTLLSSSAQVRRELIPAFVAARDEFAKVDVPKGAQDAADLTRAAMQTVIDRATTLADRIDANRSYTFTYGEAFQAAITAVEDFATQADGDFAEAVNSLKDLQ